MTGYEIALFVHVTAIALWMGGGFTSMLFLRALPGASAETSSLVVGRIHKLGDKVFGPATGLALLSGLYLVWDGPWKFSELWVVLGLVGIAIAFVLGAGFHSRIGGRALAQAEAGETDALVATLEQWVRIGRIDLVLITLVIADMVFKPTL